MINLNQKISFYLLIYKKTLIHIVLTERITFLDNADHNINKASNRST